MPRRTVCFVGLYPPSDTAEPEAFLERMPLLRALPRLLGQRGYAVHVVQRHRGRSRHFVRDGVSYRFVGPFPVRADRVASRLPFPRSRRHRRVNSPAIGALRALRSIRPDLIHLHGATLHVNHALLLATNVGTPVVMQYHGGYPPAGAPGRWIQRRNFDRTCRYLFSTREHAAPFVEAGVIRHPDRIRTFMETSSTFAPMPREEARRTTKMYGSPVFLWAARLDPVKDPLTALRGFEAVAREQPTARLYMHYASDELLPQVRAFVAARPLLRERVHLGGRAAFGRMERIYNSADFLLQTSRREFSGCAVLEAMACGVIPVVTDIPSFRAMTDGGRAGVLFSPGDDVGLAHGVLRIPLDSIPDRSRRVREHFEAALSFPVLADRLDGIYREVLM